MGYSFDIYDGQQEREALTALRELICRAFPRERLALLKHEITIRIQDGGFRRCMMALPPAQRKEATDILKGFLLRHSIPTDGLSGYLHIHMFRDNPTGYFYVLKDAN